MSQIKYEIYRLSSPYDITVPRLLTSEPVETGHIGFDAAALINVHDYFTTAAARYSIVGKELDVSGVAPVLKIYTYDWIGKLTKDAESDLINTWKLCRAGRPPNVHALAGMTGEYLRSKHDHSSIALIRSIFTRVGIVWSEQKNENSIDYCINVDQHKCTTDERILITFDSDSGRLITIRCEQ